MFSPIQYTADLIGVHADLLRIALCIVGSFPLGSILKRIPPHKKTAKDLYIIGVAMVYLIGIFNLGKQTAYLMSACVVTYGLSTYFQNLPLMPWLNFVFQISALLYTHAKEQMTGEDYVNTIGISGTQMIAVQRLVAFAWDMHDSTRDQKMLSDRQKEMQIESAGFLRFFSYIFFFPTVFTGPSCTFKEYNAWFELSMFENKVIPRAGKALYLKILSGIFWIVVYTQMSSISLDLTYYDEPWYVNSSFFSKVLYTSLKGFSFRSKYYSAWILAEAACIHTGLGYNGEINGKPQWDRMCNVKPLKVEFGQNMRGILADWNIGTAKWLRYYVFLRLAPDFSKPGAFATWGTFIVSAIWHGTRPGYYLTFITAALDQTFGKVYRRNLRPVFVNTPLKPVYDIVCIIGAKFALDFSALPFMVLDLKPALMIWKSVYFYLFIVYGFSYVALQSPLSKPVRRCLRQLSHEKRD